MEYAGLIRGALADYSVPFLNLAGVDLIDLLITVELADPFCGAVINDGHFSVA